MRWTNAIAEFQRLWWRGRVISRENIAYFIPFWLWLLFRACDEVMQSSERMLPVTFYLVFVISWIPLVARRLGVGNAFLFGYVIPAAAVEVVIVCLRSFVRS
jgi:hypothetical protein